MSKVFIVFRQYGYDTPEIMGVFLCYPDACKLRDSLIYPYDVDCLVWVSEEAVIGAGG